MVIGQIFYDRVRPLPVWCGEHMFIHAGLCSTVYQPPFPFEHITILSVDGDSTWYQIDYTPISAAAHDPYWLVWSLMLYTGIATMIMATTAQKLRNKI